jgi:hypothetical protein
MTASADDAIKRWVAISQGQSLRYLRASNIVSEDDRLYSYGHHFELARPLRDKRGKAYAYLLNGDTFSVHTSQHQASVRNALLKYDVERIIIPYSALDSAGIDRDSIRPVHVKPDGWVTTEHHSTTPPEDAMWRDEVMYHNGGYYAEPVEVSQEDGVTHYRWKTQGHQLGESLIRARVTWWTFDPGGSKRHHRWAYYLSGFDQQESRALYFFCELPNGSKPATVAEAYEVLKPDPVRMAEQMNRPVFRQGDIFGVPLERMDVRTLKAMSARIERRVTLNSPKPGVNLPYVLGTNHTATEVAYLPNGVTLARGTMYHDPSGRDPDHARRRLGDGKSWHVVIKNTVPIGRR